MITIELPSNPPESNSIVLPRETGRDFILGRIDLVAIIITLLGVCLLGAVALVLAVMALSKLVCGLWADPLERWPIILLGVAMVWVTIRWKKSWA